MDPLAPSRSETSGLSHRPSRQFRERVESLRGLGVPSKTHVLVAAFLAFAITFLCWGPLEASPRYDEPIVGTITWTHGDKDRDYRALALFLATSLAATWALAGWTQRFAAGPDGTETARAATAALGLALAPLAFWGARRVAFPESWEFPIDAVLLVALVLWTTGALAWHRRALTAGTFWGLLGAALLVDLFGALGGCAATTLVDRFRPQSLASRPGLFWALLASGAIVAMLATAAAITRARDLDHARDRLRRLLGLAQLPLPLLYFVLVPPRVLAGSRPLPPFHQPSLTIVLAVVVTLSLLSLVRRTRAGRDAHLFQSLCPWCVGAVAVFLQVRPAGMPSLSRDLFHVGEQVLPWHQWSHFGKVPYVDFIPIHGLMPLVRGVWNDFFFQGTAATFAMVDPLLMALWALATFLAVWGLAGPFPALLVALALGLAAPTVFDRLYFLVPSLLMLGLPALVSRPLRWLCAWCVTLAFLAAYNFAVGTAYLLGTAPLVFWFGWKAWRGSPRGLLLMVGAAVLSLAALAGSGTSRGISLGFLQYFRENAATNSVLHGIPWGLTLPPDRRGPGLASHPFLLDVARLAWVGALFVLAWKGWRAGTDMATRGRPPLLPVCVASVGALLFLSNWSLGRVDPGQWSRPGCVSAVVMGSLLPAVLLMGRDPTHCPALVAALVGAVGLFSSTDARDLPARLRGQAVAALKQPSDFRLVDGRALGLPMIGKVANDPEFLEEHRHLKTSLAEFLRPGETYLDLTNRSAYYFHLDLPVPSLYAAHFVSGNRATQERMLATLREVAPPVVLIAPAVNFDHILASLKSYHLYCEFIDRYVVVERSPFTFLVDPARAPDAGAVGSPEQLAVLERVFATEDLRKLPSAWGDSWSTMAPRFEEVLAFRPDRSTTLGLTRRSPTRFRTEGPEARIAWDLDALGDDRGDFLKLEFTKRRGGKVRLRVRWRTEAGDVDGPWLTPTGGTLLVPLGADPRWRLAKRVDAIELVVVGEGQGLEFDLSGAAIWRYRPL